MCRYALALMRTVDVVSQEKDIKINQLINTLFDIKFAYLYLLNVTVTVSMVSMVSILRLSDPDERKEKGIVLIRLYINMQKKIFISPYLKSS